MLSEHLVIVTHGLVALALIAAATVLLALGHIDTTTAMGLYTAAVVAVGAGTSTAMALKVPAKPTQPPPEA